jgi:hypothetical protein
MDCARLGPDAARGVGMTELMAIALERQNLHGAATAARRVIYTGRPWLRFLGWWREPGVPFLDAGQRAVSGSRRAVLAQPSRSIAAPRGGAWNAVGDFFEDGVAGGHPNEGTALAL